MKKIILISYFFNQSNIGPIRVRGLAKYLPAFGWEPTIVTAKAVAMPKGEFKVIETPYADLRITWKRKLGIKQEKTFKQQFGLPSYKNKTTVSDILLHLWEEMFAYPDLHYGWYEYAIDASVKILEEGYFDAMLSSSGPVTSHLVAKELKDKYKIPWVADFRDLWTQNPYYRYSPIREFFERRLELRTLSTADALTTVSQPLADQLCELHKGEKTYAIPSGFDPDKRISGTPPSEKFSIVYTGVLYKGKRDPEPLLKAIKELLLKGIIAQEDLAIDFYGYDVGWLVKDVERHGLQNQVHIHGSIPREEALKKQREAQVLLLLTWDNPQERGVYTGKIFDYLAAQRPILAIGCPEGVVKELLAETKAGIYATSVEEVKRVLEIYYSEYKLKGYIDYEGEKTKIDKYSQKEMARKFAAVLDSITNKLG